MSIASPFTFDSLPVPTLLVETDGTIIVANRATERVRRGAARDMVGTTLEEHSPDVASRWPDLVRQVRATGQAIDGTQYAAAADDIRHLQFVMSLVEHEGREAVLIIALDITEHKAAEQAARVRAEADEQHAAKQRLESLGLVAGGIAHDFNNLLVGVLAEASAAREDTELTPGTHEALRRIEAAARRMSQLTRQLLAYAGRGQFVTIPTDPDQLLHEIQEQLVKIVESPLVVEVVAGAGAHVVEADHGLLRQVVVNLVANAADAARAKVQIATRVVSREGQPWWQLEVSDDGPGIEATTLGRIFEPFFTTKPGRHGLGLSAVHGIVRRLQGDVEVDTSHASGSRFRVRLPIVRGAEPVAPKTERKTETHFAPQKLAGLRVLVADDEPSVRATVRRLLERRGATVVVASDGLEAEARLADDRFDLIVLDVSMPGRTGHEVMVVARRVQPGVPVVLMSGYTERIRGEGSEEEADTFLEKPFTARVLDASIDEVLKGKKR